MDQKVTVIGLGNMGAALARALKAGGYQVWGWTRSPSRRQACAGLYTIPETVEEAIVAAEVIVLCIADFSAAKQFLQQEAGILKGKTLIQLTSETPREATEFSAVAGALGIRVLDGAIATMPATIGSKDAVIYYSGPKDVFESHKDLLTAITGTPIYCGPDPSSASSMDMAWLSFFYSAAFGLIQGIAICRSAGLDPSLYLNATHSYLLEMLVMSKDFERQTRTFDFVGDQASVKLHLFGAEHLLHYCEDNNLDIRLPKALVDLLRTSVDAGFGDLEFAAAANVILPRD